MLTLSEIAELACDKVNRNDTDSLALCKKFVKRRYQLVYNSHLWKDSLEIVETNNDASDYSIAIMPRWMERVVSVKEGDENTLSVEEQSLFFRRDPGLIGRDGSCSAFHQIKPYFWPILLTNAYGITVTVDDDDAGRFFYLKDRSGHSTTVQFQAGLDEESAPVISLSSFDLDNLRITKDITTGQVALNVGPTLVILGPEDTSLRYERIRLLENPGETVNLMVLGKRRADLLEDDGDAPQVQGIDDALIAHAQADMLERDRQYAKAELKRKEANAQVKVAIDLERNQSASSFLITPASYYLIQNGDDI